MPINIIPIRSSSNPANTYPWCEFTFDPVTRQINITKFNGLMDAVKEAAILGQRIVNLTPGKLTERHFLIIRLDGTLAFVPLSELPAVCYAHLAEFNPLTLTVNVLQFVEAPELG